jgi:hypothetical protein
LKSVHIKYFGDDPYNDLRKIRGVLEEAGLEKRVARYTPKKS